MNSPIYSLFKSNGGSEYKNPEIEKMKDAIKNNPYISKKEKSACIKELNTIAGDLLSGVTPDFNLPI